MLTNKPIPLYLSLFKAEDIITLDGSLSVGGVNQWTPYIRSKVKTTEIYRGCLGVSLALIFSKILKLFVLNCAILDMHVKHVVHKEYNYSFIEYNNQWSKAKSGH